MNTKALFVLVAFLVSAAAQTPNTCPKPPLNLLCAIFVKNSCVDNSTCPTGTLCCTDGCHYRCRDPNNNNRGAGTGIKQGTCPSQLSPPPGPCASDSDECIIDADCHGTKKCCFNKCFRECVEPGIAAIQDGCPALKPNPRCHMSFGNKCFKHSDCSYLKDGHCCYDGCRRRCATTDGFPSRIEAARPGKCPVMAAPEFCVSDADECEFDGDCFPGKKCCSNTCFTRCVDPVGLPSSNASDLGVGSLNVPEGEASGQCPFTSKPKSCPLLGHACNLDKDCQAGFFCCFDGCRRKCWNRNDTGSATGVDKKGTCPTLIPPEFCAADVDQCFFDWDCSGERKCCSNGCYKVCVAPSLEAAAGEVAVKCPEPVASQCSRSKKHQCDDSSDCLTGTNCCHDGCRRRCVSSTTTDTCPEPPQNLICPFLRNACVDDASCRPGTICCSDGCRKRCMDPSLSGGPGSGYPGITRPGTCPSLKPPSQFCPSDYDECLYDWDCEPTTKKCCSNGCYKVCAEPTGAGELQDKCPSPKKPQYGCPVSYRNQCSNHTDCSYLSGGLCCYDGCRRRCATPDGFPSRIENPRPGKCPRLLSPEFCISHFDECENDGDCFPVKKCCSNGCFNRCVNPNFGEIDSIALVPANKCPFVTPTEKCNVGIRSTCNYDSECENGTYCCFTGCRRQCWDPEGRSSAVLNKTGTCPVPLPPPPQPCPSDVHECYMDNDCVKDKKCCSNGCYRLCVSPSKASAAALAKCPPPKSFNCTASMRSECTTECPDGKICCFDGCSRRCIGYESAPVTRLYQYTFFCDYSVPRPLLGD